MGQNASQFSGEHVKGERAYDALMASFRVAFLLHKERHPVFDVGAVLKVQLPLINRVSASFEAVRSTPA